ncbi:MAG: family 43 glycosylhydrolase [Planctomycetota bacterium]
MANAHRLGRIFLAITAAWVIGPSTAAAISPVDQCRYTTDDPGEGWHAPSFDDSSWLQARGGLGTARTPNARIGAVWDTPRVWLRKTYKFDAVPANVALRLHHDEDAKVYLNGVLAAEVTGFTRNYKTVPISQAAADAIVKGTNVLAVECRHKQGSQYIDVHLMRRGVPPSLPSLERELVASPLMTRWGEKLTAKNAWTEYPRPQLQRDVWTNLNGYWDYTVTPGARRKSPRKWKGKILTPFCLESKLSGVQELLAANEALWYRRTISGKPRAGLRRILHFEAVDYRCEVFVNGESVGRHRGGNTPFSFDVTDTLRDGDNELVVRVVDETQGYQLKGKQSRNPRGIRYTQVSGIWQTVWSEDVPASHLRDLKIATDPKQGSITVRPVTTGKGSFSVVVKDGDSVVARGEGLAGDDAAPVSLRIRDAKLWSPESPHLYSIEAVFTGDLGVEDRVTSYAGIRSVGRERDADGHWRFTLNGKPIFHWGTLDQGWWPDGLLTPPSDEAMAFEIEWLKAAGFNMIRKHIKVEPRRYYYHCDRLGMMVWQDHVSGGPRPQWTRLEPGPIDARWPDQRHAQFMRELDRMIDTLEDSPSIVVWVPFNERWGQHRTMKVGRWTVERDPSRLVNIASGGNFWPVGHIVDAHKYPHPDFPFDNDIAGRFDDYVKVVGEFGGHGLAVKGHLWDPSKRNWGYGGLPENPREFKDRYRTSIAKLHELRARGIAGGVYTQTTDVEGEINGLMTYDRKVEKISPAELAEVHAVLFQAPPAATAEAAATGVAATKPSVDAQPTDRKPGPVMPADEIRAGLKSHDRALYIKSGWIRDPYITLGPDGVYYLTGTQPNENDPREQEQPYNTGLGPQSIVGQQVRLWKSADLIDWEYVGPIFTLGDAVRPEARGRGGVLWAPEVHWLGDRWALVHCPKRVASLAFSAGSELTGPWTHPMGVDLGDRHDPSLFKDDDGVWNLLWQNTLVAPLSSDFTRYTADPVRIDPSGDRPGRNGKPITRIGHEGATMIKVGGKYVHLGTAWSTDRGRQGSYNLYYCVADKITGPYGPRKFAGRFLGHGTPFQDKQGRWWCTAFFNGNVPPLPREGIQERDLSETAQTINEQGVTIVPLDVRLLDDGDVHIRAKDPAYATPGPDEAQKFD